MAFTYHRTIYFQDTDAAGVVYFANVLAICHEAYEASLVKVNINLKEFFSNPNFAIPIIHASVDFRHPIFCGTQLTIQLSPTPISDNGFEVSYQVFSSDVVDKWVAKAITKHVCIDPKSRTRQPLSQEILDWLKISLN